MRLASCVALLWVATASGQTLDREAIRQAVREELEAERKAKEAEWIEVGSKPALAGLFANGFRWQSEDKAFAYHLGGRLEWDNAWFTQDDNLLIGPSPGTRLADGTALRRLRMRADGTAWEQVDFVCEVNFANIQDVANTSDQTVSVGSVGLTDCHLTFRQIPFAGNLRLGHFVAPYGLERFTSANVFPYMERSSIFDAFWGPTQRQSGLMVFDSFLDDRLTVHAALTRVGKGNLNSFGFDAEDGRYAAGARVTGLAWWSDEGRTFLHLGADFAHQALAGNRFIAANRVPLRAGAGPSQVPNVLTTGPFFSPSSANIACLEAAAVCGPFSLSAEWATTFGGPVFAQFDGVRYSGPRGNVSYQAFYIEGGWFLTPGDHRRYDRKHGTWDRTVPAENAFGVKAMDGWRFGSGAVELLARLSYLDLVSGSPPLTPASDSAGARAGRQRDITLGVNWHLNPQTRLMVNYVWTHLDSVAAGASGDIHGIGTRLHFDF